ncbi:MAG: glycoside hydrolase family 2 TIM barrel-domain containing protein [Paraglaciecola sp.]|uniref:glycoside hydrolase family 2 TIM barrel-domain containing protein n=1 Tax=Paraglaciecola sp. TaxID=1920173 RepID=UPI003297ECD7
MSFRAIFMCLISYLVLDVHGQVKTIETASTSSRVNINLDWRYHKGGTKHQPNSKQWSVEKWQKVSLPHSYALTSINLDNSNDDKSQLTFHRDLSFYERKIDVSGSPGSKVYLEFEGAHQKTRLWVNGQYVGEHAVGAYTPFHFDISEFVTFDQTNTLTIELDNRRNKHIPPDGHTADYVLFGGLYRDVYINVLDSLHFTFDWDSSTSGVFVTTPAVTKKDATVTVRSEIINMGNQPRTFYVQTYIVDQQSIVIQRKRTEHNLNAGATRLVRHTTGIDENLHLWSPDSPYLYKVVSQLLDENGRVLHSKTNPLGIRKFELALGKGLLINGEPIEIIGANRHQHFPYIGDAVPNNLHRLDALKFKRSGMNLVRLAHYPHDNAFLQACDELGLIVVEEPPTWIGMGDELWMTRLELATRRMIRNHRNHPSVLGWGAGINHRGTIKRLHFAAKEEDPTRISMNNGTLWTGEQHSGITDLYAVMDYRGAKRQADDLLFAMEHTGSIDSLSLQEIVSRYKGDPNLIGLASWSAHDSQSFIKRDKQYPNLSVWQASSWDAFRLPKPNYFWYQSELTSEPMVHIADTRGQFEDQVQVFTNAPEIELLHNNRSLGRYKAKRLEQNQHLNSPSILIPFNWQSGTLTALAYHADKKRVVAKHHRTKEARGEKLVVTFDTDGFDKIADGSSIILAYAKVTNNNGELIDNDTPSVRFELQGDGQIIGDETIGANPVTWRNGHAPIMIRVGTTATTLKLSAHADGLETGTASIDLQDADEAKSNVTSSHMFDPLTIAVDFGNREQHPQENFYIWSHQSGDDSRLIAAANGQEVKIALSGATLPLSWDNTWGVPGDLSFLIEDGVNNVDGQPIRLDFSQLPQGKYELKTWHHMLSDDGEAIRPFRFNMPKNSRSQSVTNYRPTFGKRIAITEAGGGERGDGGSNKGAAGFALHTFAVDSQGEASLIMAAPNGNQQVRLNGFRLTQLVQGAGNEF